MAKNNKSISDKMSDWIRNILSCCDRTEEDERPRSLQIVSLLFPFPSKGRMHSTHLHYILTPNAERSDQLQTRRYQYSRP